MPQNERRIAELLADPVTRMMMRADRVDERAFAKDLAALVSQLDRAKRHAAAPSGAAPRRDGAQSGTRRAVRDAAAFCGACCS
jgi:hypothetical protein